MNNKKPFKNLKNALLIIAANQSVIMKKISESKNTRSIENPFVVKKHSYGIGDTSNIAFDVVVKNDYMPELSFSKKYDKFVIIYNEFTYIFTLDNIRIHQGMGTPNINVDITDIESRADMFTLSTMRDFYDLEYSEVEAIQYLIKESTRNFNGKLKHV